MTAWIARCGVVVGLAACADPLPQVIDTDTDVDTAPPDPRALRVACDDAREAVYAVPDGLDAWDGSQAGAVVGCAADGGRSRVDVAQRLDGVEVEARSGHLAYLLGLRGRAPGGDWRLSTARLLVPEEPAPGPRPLVVLVPDGLGLADACAPSLRPDALEAMVLPWSATGTPVLVLDPPGLGTPGLPDVAHPGARAEAILDGATAALSVLSDELASGEVYLVGYGQGAGAVLATRALDPGDLDVIGITAIGGGPPLVDPTPRWRLATLDLTGGDGFVRAREAVALQTDLAAVLDPARRLEALHADRADTLGELAETTCDEALVQAIATPAEGYDPPDTLGQLMDDTFRKEVVGCVDRNDRCTERAQALRDRRLASVVDVEGRLPVTLLGGQDDARFGPTELSCLEEAAATEVEACILPGVDQASLATAVVPHALASAGLAEEPGCDDGVTLPRCPY